MRWRKRKDVCHWLKKISDKFPLEIAKNSFTGGSSYNIDLTENERETESDLLKFC